MQLRRKSSSEEGPVFYRGDKPFESNERTWLVVDLIADYLRFLRQAAVDDVTKATSGVITEDLIRWCITVPAIWTEPQKQLMRRAAEKAGLTRANDELDDRLVLALEPEAAALFCQSDDVDMTASALQPNDVIMIVDCGGGTVDITTHRVLDGLAMEEIVVGGGGAHGSSYVDREFERHLAERLGADAIRAYEQESPNEYVGLMAAWERLKCSYGDETVEGEGETYFLPLDARLYRLLNERYPNTLRRLASEQAGDDSRIYLRDSDMQRMFKPAVGGTVNRIREQLNRLGSDRCNYMFLVGGFSRSPVLRSAIEAEFASRADRIVVPPRPERAVLGGAVYFAMDPRRLRYRRSRFTYGLLVSEVFDELRHPDNKKFFVTDKNMYYCRDIFKTLIKRGELVDFDETRTFTFSPLDRSQKEMYFGVFSTTKKSPKFTDEEGVGRVGHFVVEMPDMTGGLERTVQVRVHVGLSQLQIEAKDLTSGREAKTEIQFSYSYFLDEQAVGAINA
jgi:molecular chaperone DnaK (HSP70)